MKTIKKIEGKDALSVHWIIFASMFHVLFVAGGIVALIAGAWVASVIHSEDMAGNIGMLVFFLFPPWMSYVLSSKRLRKINSVYRRLAEKIQQTLTRTDYFNTGEFGGIGVDVENNMIAVVSANDDFKLNEPLKFNFEKIISYKAFSPGHTVLNDFGAKNLQKNEILRQNLAEQAKSEQKTGLYIDLDDMNDPQVFVQMNYDEAEKWFLIFKKLRKGTLEPQITPMLFPQS